MQNLQMASSIRRYRGSPTLTPQRRVYMRLWRLTTSEPLTGNNVEIIYQYISDKALSFIVLVQTNTSARQICVSLRQLIPASPSHVHSRSRL